MKAPVLPVISHQSPPDVRRAFDALRVWFAKGGAFPTVDEMRDAGVIGVNQNGGVTTPGSAQVPYAPLGFTVTGAFASIILQWSPAAYTGHSHTEIYRAQVDDFGQAVKVATTPSFICPDTPPNSATSEVYYYWIRFVNTDGVQGPINNLSGTAGSTSDSPAYLLELLASEITESQLYADLNGRINLIDAADTVVGSVAARVLAEAEARGTAISSERTLRESADSALASEATTLAARVTSSETGITTNAAAIQTEATTRAGADSALASDMSALTATVGGNTSAISSEATTRANADTALASSVSTLSSTVSGHTTSIQTVTETANGLSAQWTTKIDNNGFLSGFGLASSAVNSTPLADFTVLADRFSIINPNTTPLSISSITRVGSTATVTTTTAHGRVANDYVVIVGCEQAEYNGTKKVLTTPTSTTLTYDVAGTPASPATGVNKKLGVAAVPFVVVGGVTYINTALIQNATITNAMIGDLSADKITTGEMHADRIAASTLAAISADLGAITAGSLNINNKFLVDSSGNATIQSATSGARLEIKNNVIKVFDTSGTLRVQIGDLSA